MRADGIRAMGTAEMDVTTSAREHFSNRVRARPVGTSPGSLVPIGGSREPECDRAARHTCAGSTHRPADSGPRHGSIAHAAGRSGVVAMRLI